MRANFELRDVLFDDCDFSHAEVVSRTSKQIMRQRGFGQWPACRRRGSAPLFYRSMGGGFNLMLPRSP
jgi:hypothetical protein